MTAAETAIRTDDQGTTEAGLSPLRPSGWRVVARKEFADYLLSLRFYVLLLIVGVAAVGSVLAAAGTLQEAGPQVSGDRSLFLLTFVISAEDLPSFFAFSSIVAFLGPLLGIAFGFDAICGEHSQGTLPRLVSKPIYRDDVINGKFAASLTLIGLTIAALTAMVAALAMLRLGLRPEPDEIMRLVIFVGISIVYVGVWLGLAILCSVLFKRAATSVLVSLAAWLLFTIFAGLLVPVIADRLAPPPDDLATAADAQQEIDNLRMEQTIDRFSPKTLYEEAARATLDPSLPSLDLELVDPLYVGVERLSVGQSLLVAWPQVVALIAMTVALFAGAYISFMRQEIRA